MPHSPTSLTLSIRSTPRSSIPMSQNDKTINESRGMRTSSLPVSTQSHIPISKNVARSGRSIAKKEKEEAAQQAPESTTLSLNEAIILSDLLDSANQTIEDLFTKLKERDAEKIELEKRLEEAENDAQEALECKTVRLYEAAEQLDRAEKMIRERDGEIRELRDSMREAEVECGEILKIYEEERQERLREEGEEECERLRMGEPAVGGLRRKLLEAEEDVKRLRVLEAINKENKMRENFVGSL